MQSNHLTASHDSLDDAPHPEFLSGTSTTLPAPTWLAVQTCLSSREALCALIRFDNMDAEELRGRDLTSGLQPH